jgi:cytidyltransferase-like protein
MEKVFVSGSFDPLHSGHVAFFETASTFGDLYVGIGSDASITQCKHKVFHPQEERLYMVQSIKYVKDAWVNSGMGELDFIDDIQGMDILIVNEDQHSPLKEGYCYDFGIEYIVLKRIPKQGIPKRTSTEYRDDYNNN